MDNSSFKHGNVMDRGNKKMEIDQSDFRLQCRISCGADQVVKSVWPYILTPDFVCSYVDDSNNDDDDDDDSDDDSDDDNYYDNDNDNV
jgi:hypothetical protein